MKKLCNNLFNFNPKNGLKISITNNELYNQLLLYMFFCVENNLIILTSNINESNNLYYNLKDYYKNVYIFPEDDYLTKKAVATSKELLMLRINLLNNINLNEKNIIICHVNSFLKKLPNPKSYKNKIITIKKDMELKREKLVDLLSELKYTKESLVTNRGEYSIRGFVIDIFPIDEEYPIRIELFNNIVEKIKCFDASTQLSIKEIDTFSVKPYSDEIGTIDSTILDYIKDPLVVIQDEDKVMMSCNSLNDQIKYYEGNTYEYEKIENIKISNKIYVDLLNNAKVYDYAYTAQKIDNYNDNIDEFIKDISLPNSILFTNNEKFSKKVLNINDQILIEKEYLNQGFIFEGKSYYSENDLKKQKHESIYNSITKMGEKISNLDKITKGDYVVHKINGIGIYMGINTITKGNIEKDYIMIQYKGNDKLYLPVEDVSKLYKYSSKEGSKPKIYNLNSKEWAKTKLKIKSNIKDITDELLNIYKNRNIATVQPYEKDTEMQLMFESEFEYEETPDQLKSVIDIKNDMEAGKPMDRLLCGDVGYGKTEVIFRAIFKTIMNNKQVMYLCPTTLLSNQQYLSAVNRFKNYGVNIALLNRYTTAKETKRVLQDLALGRIDVLFGTHRLLSKDVIYKDLGFLVIDEEQRFGVEHKEKIKKYKNNVHVLSVSATPIPRSLQMSLVGIRDLSLIETAPKNRYAVQTYVINYDPMLLREVILKEKSRNGQVFILYNKIEDMEKLASQYQKLIPEVSIKYAHGKMTKNEMQDIMYDFTEGKFDCLLSTTIIENGIDIPNANTIIIMNADKFGLSQLYQIRGRVGRGDSLAYAYLMYDKSKILTETALKRLEAIKEFTELGSGYKISMRDLSIRGAGDLLGSKQAGFIDSVGIDMYLDLINEEINQVEEDTSTTTDSLNDISTHISSNYSEEDEIIIDIHKKITSISKFEDLERVKAEIIDRFGTIDKTIEIYMLHELFQTKLDKLKIKLIENNKDCITIRLDENIFKQLNIENLFIKATQINTKFNFKYRNNYILISLNKQGLENPYIVYCLNLILYIEKASNI